MRAKVIAARQKLDYLRGVPANIVPPATDPRIRRFNGLTVRSAQRHWRSSTPNRRRPKGAMPRKAARARELAEALSLPLAAAVALHTQALQAGDGEGLPAASAAHRGIGDRAAATEAVCVAIGRVIRVADNSCAQTKLGHTIPATRELARLPCCAGGRAGNSEPRGGTRIDFRGVSASLRRNLDELATVIVAGHGSASRRRRGARS